MIEWLPFRIRKYVLISLDNRVHILKIRMIYVLLLFVFHSASSLKFLAHSSQFAKSAVNFNARVSDVLIKAGHEVVILAPILDSTIGGVGRTKARVIEIQTFLFSIPPCEKARKFEEFATISGASNVWRESNPISILAGWGGVMDAFLAECNATLAHPGLIEQLKAEKFDVAFTEPSLDYCGPGLFYLLGIDKWAIMNSLAIVDGDFHYSQMASNPSYVPSAGAMFGGNMGEAMTFTERFNNLLTLLATKYFFRPYLYKYTQIMRQFDPTMPDTEELFSQNSFVFMNSEPLVDFPRVNSARIIDIGGISVAEGHKHLNQTWCNVLNIRTKNVFISFGTIAKAYSMPLEYKMSIVQVAKSLPNVTFIWKYEKPEHRISEGVDNLIESSWIPQNDLLNDSRLSLFVTHCGQGSTTEAIAAGIPLVVIPVAYDQLRNGHQVKRNGNGIMLNKMDLATPEPLRRAVLEILSNDKYRKRANEIKKITEERPFTMREVLVNNMEFLGKHGPFRQLDHYGRHLNLIQYYLIDVILFVVCIFIVTSFLTLLSLRRLFGIFKRYFKSEIEMICSS